MQNEICESARREYRSRQLTGQTVPVDIDKCA